MNNKLGKLINHLCYPFGPFPDPNLRLYDIKYTIYHKLYQKNHQLVKIVKNLLFYDFCMCISDLVSFILMGHVIITKTWDINCVVFYHLCHPKPVFSRRKLSTI